MGVNGGEAYANPTSLNFTMANWDRPQTVTINARQNTDDGGSGCGRCR